MTLSTVDTVRLDSRLSSSFLLANSTRAIMLPKAPTRSAPKPAAPCVPPRSRRLSGAGAVETALAADSAVPSIPDRAAKPTISPRARRASLSARLAPFDASTPPAAPTDGMASLSVEPTPLPEAEGSAALISTSASAPAAAAAAGNAAAPSSEPSRAMAKKKKKTKEKSASDRGAPTARGASGKLRSAAELVKEIAIARPDISGATLESLREQFEKWDADQSNSLSLREVANMLEANGETKTHLEIKRLIADVSTEKTAGENVVTFGDWVACVCPPPPRSSGAPGSAEAKAAAALAIEQASAPPSLLSRIGNSSLASTASFFEAQAYQRRASRAGDTTAAVRAAAAVRMEAKAAKKDARKAEKKRLKAAEAAKKEAAAAAKEKRKAMKARMAAFSSASSGAAAADGEKKTKKKKKKVKKKLSAEEKVALSQKRALEKMEAKQAAAATAAAAKKAASCGISAVVFDSVSDSDSDSSSVDDSSSVEDSSSDEE